MNRTILLSLIGAALAVSPLHAGPKPTKPKPIPVPTQSDPVVEETPRIHEFQDDQIGLVLRTLARQAGLNIVISDDVTGVVNMRLDNQTPRQAINIIAQAKDLIVEEKGGVTYVRPRNPPPPGTVKEPETAKSLEDAVASIFTPALTKAYDAVLDYQAKPETAQKIAKAKKALYDALIAEGFTKDEAFRIILTNQELTIPNAK